MRPERPHAKQRCSPTGLGTEYVAADGVPASEEDAGAGVDAVVDAGIGVAEVSMMGTLSRRTHAPHSPDSGNGTMLMRGTPDMQDAEAISSAASQW